VAAVGPIHSPAIIKQCTSALRLVWEGGRTVLDWLEANNNSKAWWVRVNLIPRLRELN